MKYFWKKYVFFFSFSFIGRTFQFLVKRFPTEMSKLNPTCPQETLEEKYFFEKIFTCSYRFMKWAKKLGFVAKTFGRVVQTAFDLSMGSFWEVFLKNKSDTFYHSRTLSKPFSAFSQKFFSRVVRKHYLKFQSLPDIERKVFFLLSINCSSAARTAFYVFTGTVWMNFFLEKNVFLFFCIIRTLSEKKLAFYQLFYDGVSKSVFYMSMEKFRRKIFLIILFRFPILFRAMTGKKFGFPSSFFRQGWKNYILCLNRYNLRKAFRKKNFSLSLLGNEQKISRCKDSILRVPMNILKNFFGKNVFLMNFAYCANFVSFLSKDFQQDCQNWIVRFHNKTWKENNLFKKLCVCYSFSEMSQKLMALWPNFFRQRCENCFWCVLKIIERYFFLKKVRYFLAFSHTEQTLFGIQSKNFVQGC